MNTLNPAHYMSNYTGYLGWKFNPIPHSLPQEMEKLEADDTQFNLPLSLLFIGDDYEINQTGPEDAEADYPF